MRTVDDRADSHRLRALIVLLWRAGLRISEALALQESDLDPTRGAILVRRGKGGKRREVGMDRWAWNQLEAWMEIRRRLPIGVAAVRYPRADCRPALGGLSRPQATASRGRQRGRERALRAASTAACPPR
jgi:integrase